MLGRLVVLFVTVPLLELLLLVEIGRRIGLTATIALVVGTGIAGAALARHQGLTTLHRFQQALAEGRMPHRELLEGILILVAGAVLLTPGVVTDAAGFLLLVPALRRRFAAAVGRRLAGGIVVAGDPPSRRSAPDDGPIDVDYRVD